MTVGGTWTNMPAAVTEFQNSPYYRTKADLSNAAQARIVANVVTSGSASATIRAQYSINQSAWSFLDGTAGPSVAVVSGLQVSPWINLTSAAKADVYLRLVGQDGNGTADPSFSRIDIQVK